MFRDYWPAAKLNESSPTVQHYRKACRAATDFPVTSRHVFVGCGRSREGTYQSTHTYPILCPRSYPYASSCHSPASCPSAQSVCGSVPPASRQTGHQPDKATGSVRESPSSSSKCTPEIIVMYLSQSSPDVHSPSRLPIFGIFNFLSLQRTKPVSM